MLLFPKVEYNLHRPLIAGGREIQYVHTFNYLGVIIDDRLCFSSYNHAVKRKVENKIFVLSKIRKHLDTETAFLIYKQAIFALIRICRFCIDIVYCPTVL